MPPPPRPITTHTLLVGAGPIGLELAVNLRHHDVPLLHLDAHQVGHTVSWYPRQARYFSSPQRIAIAGVPLHTPDQTKATREQYLTYLHSIVQQFNLHIQTFEPVTDLKPHDTPAPPAPPAPDTPRFTLTTPKATYHAHNVVLAIGDMHHPRRLDIPGEDLPHVSHYFDEPQRYFQQDLLIVGGKNSAVEAALRCHHAGARVTISYRQADFDKSSIKYWLLPELKALLKHDQIRFHPGTIPTQITPTHVTLSEAPAPKAPGLQSQCPPPNHTPTPIPADFVLLLTGYTQDKSLFHAAGLALHGDNQVPRINPDTMMTDLPGLYVAGTAAAGTQNSFKLYIENSHPHVARITRAITGQNPDPHLINTAAQTFGLAES